MPEVILNLLNPVVVTSRDARGYGGGPASIVGGNDCMWTDDGDTSYVEVASSQSGSGSVRFGVEQLDIPATAAVSLMRFDYVAKADIAQSDPNFHIDWNYDGATEVVGSTTYEPGDVSLGLLDISPAFIDALRAGTASTMLSSNGTATVVRVTQAQWRITYTLPGAAGRVPPIRQLQRSDGLGFSSAPRALGRTSIQGSLRNTSYL